MEYRPTRVEDALSVRALYTIHYFNYPRGYRYAGEKHEFWELFYVDRGEMLIHAGDAYIRACRGQIVFHRPGEFHSFECVSKDVSSAIVVSFACDATELNVLSGRALNVNAAERTYLSGIVDEARKAFANDPARHGDRKLIPARVEFGAEQYVRILLEMLLIGFVRKATRVPAKSAPVSRTRDECFRLTSDYIDSHIDSPLTVPALSAHAGVSESYLEKIIRAFSGMSVTAYCRARRVERAKILLKEGKMTLTQIAEAAGFSTPHYFSRVFKQVTGITPARYAALNHAYFDEIMKN